MKKELNKEQLNNDLLSEMNIAQKLGLIKQTASEIISNPDETYRKINDLLLFCKDPKDIDVVMRSMGTLCDVYCDILPGYRIREQNTKVAEEN